MRPRTQTLLAWSLFVLILAGVVVNQIGQNAFDSLSVPYLAMALVGAVIVSRTGGNRVGWVMVGIGLIAVSSALSGILADRSDVPNWSVGARFSVFRFDVLRHPRRDLRVPPSPLSCWAAPDSPLGLGCVGGRGRRRGERGARSDPAHTGRRDPQPPRGRRSPGTRGLGHRHCRDRRPAGVHGPGRGESRGQVPARLRRRAQAGRLADLHGGDDRGNARRPGDCAHLGSRGAGLDGEFLVRIRSVCVPGGDRDSSAPLPLVRHWPVGPTDSELHTGRPATCGGVSRRRRRHRGFGGSSEPAGGCGGHAGRGGDVQSDAATGAVVDRPPIRPGPV